MARIKTYLLSGGTLICALAIGYFMQYGLGAPQSAPSNAPLKVSEITLTSSAALPSMPREARSAPALPDAPVQLAAAEADTIAPGSLPQEATAGFACDITLNASPAAGAMVALTLDAPCKGSERLTVHHHGMMFTEITQPDGSLSVTVPAIVEQATFMVSFLDGTGAVASTDVTSLEFYERVVLQWRGASGLQLHAREFGAEYFGEGHVWAASASDVSNAIQGQGGFLTRLGREDSPEALMAEVYSFPAATTTRNGDIALTVEAEVTDANCNALVEAQTLERRGEAGLRVRDLTLDIPACDTTGDFLVLKNLVEDLTIAAK
ncbi:translocase [Aestuariicoccus sp. MJ-SS9]|uniref:translocase n=1 Tax=Aestuariicoccus sp. MJ-SS9 TaxID=3079855 RepID=UPI00290B1C5E|nr:translocase [Aestuariicoccus sp. MJ-SS9]MDU8910202.1 translocase [Aestuariicoccus sp. MJ-SS9]